MTTQTESPELRFIPITRPGVVGFINTPERMPRKPRCARKPPNEGYSPEGLYERDPQSSTIALDIERADGLPNAWSDCSGRQRKLPGE
jgi:hypothetical protein